MMALNQSFTLTDQEFKRIAQVVYDHCGIHLNADKRELVRSRLMRLTQNYGHSSYGAYLDGVLKDSSGKQLTEMINRISTNLTSFFREVHHFNYLKEKVLPGLLAKSGPSRIRAWSAGCSSGEEPYSIAISIAETLSNQNRANVRILASDISTNVLQTAAKGCYDESRISQMDPAILKKFFTQVPGSQPKEYQIKADVGKMLLFKQINLMEKWPITTPLDFIFCRNVMIYFDRETKEKLVNRYADQLQPGGHLFIGHSESLSNISHKLKYVGPTIYQKP
jgi:chemotaxis protein methyltransferase CheR